MTADKETLDKIEQLVLRGQTVTVDNQAFSSMRMEPVIFTPRAKTLLVHSLLGFCAYVNSKFDGAEKKDFMVVVNNEESVDLVSKIYGKDRVRETLLRAEIGSVDKFDFNTFMCQEEFAIQFRSLFVPNTKNDTDYVLQFASKLSGGTSISTEDDGITQQVGVKRGVSGNLVGKETARPIVRLAPYRTFREIKQPESEFLLRSRIDDNNVPKLALYEADGGAWKISAIHGIAEYIAQNCADVQIIA